MQTEFLERLSGFAEKTLDEETGARSRTRSGRRCPGTGGSPTPTGRCPRDPRGTGKGSEPLRAGGPGPEERLAVGPRWQVLETLEDKRSVSMSFADPLSGRSSIRVAGKAF